MIQSIINPKKKKYHQINAILLFPAMYIAVITLMAGALSVGAVKKKLKTKTVIGRVERVELPNLNINLEARIDTGAKSCSMHFSKETFFTRDGKEYIDFETEDRLGKKYKKQAQIIKLGKIKSTSGESNERYIIREKLKIGNVVREVSISLNDRSKMKYKFLVGRNFLRGAFVVDVSQSHVMGE